MEWPPKSGREQQFPEVDQGGRFDMENARRKIVEGQTGFGWIGSTDHMNAAAAVGSGFQAMGVPR
jgi:predicted NUDIX family NTP pyrophosphohydrolase